MKWSCRCACSPIMCWNATVLAYKHHECLASCSDKRQQNSSTNSNKQQVSLLCDKNISKNELKHTEVRSFHHQENMYKHDVIVKSVICNMNWETRSICCDSEQNCFIQLHEQGLSLSRVQRTLYEGSRKSRGSYISIPLDFLWDLWMSSRK